MRGRAGSDVWLARAFGALTIAPICAGFLAGLVRADPPIEGVPATARVPFLTLGNEGAANGRSCVSCHQSEKWLSHPVGVTPSIDVPTHLPLEGGTISCVTCHEADDSHPTPGGTWGRVRLRGTGDAASLCAECHVAPQSSSHAGGSMRAHLGGSRDPGRASAAARIDEESASCMSCHDGTAASDAGLHARPGRRRDGLGEHPIGIAYDKPGRGHDAPRFVPVARLDPRVRLFDGAVGCGSCHSVYAPTKSLLVMDNLRSRLCLSCHAE